MAVGHRAPTGIGQCPLFDLPSARSALSGGDPSRGTGHPPRVVDQLFFEYLVRHLVQRRLADLPALRQLGRSFGTWAGLWSTVRDLNDGGVDPPPHSARQGKAISTRTTRIGFVRCFHCTLLSGKWDGTSTSLRRMTLRKPCSLQCPLHHF